MAVIEVVFFPKTKFISIRLCLLNSLNCSDYKPCKMLQVCEGVSGHAWTLYIRDKYQIDKYERLLKIRISH